MMTVKTQEAVALPDYLRRRGLIRATIFSPANTWKMILLAGGFLWLHQGYLHKLAKVWWTEPDWSHGFIIPLFCLYFLASNYQKLLKIKVKPAYSGLVLVLIGLAMETTAFWLQNDYGVYLGMIALLFGMVLWLGGWQVIKIVWLPILFLIFAINIPEMIYRDIAYELQQFAAKASVVVLQLLGVQADMAGELGSAETVISLWDAGGKSHQLNVEEACSGMRLLMAFGALAVAVSYLSDRPAWQRVVLIAFALPIALICNLLRVVITGLLYHQGYPDYAQGLFHTFTGLFMLVPAGLMYLGLAKLMDMLVIEDYSVREQVAKSQTGPARSADISPDPEKSPADAAEAELRTTSVTKAGLWRQIVTDKHFIACLVIIMLAASSLQAYVKGVQGRFVKEPAPLRAELSTLAKTMGSFEAYAFEDPKSGKSIIDRVLPEDMIQVLGTDVYLDRTYVDCNPSEEETPMISVFTTHYTGKPVLVPHVPERCQAAVGYIQTGSETFKVKVPGLGLPDDTLSVRASIFSGSDQNILSRTRSFAIIYFFVANGEYFDDWKLVRLHMKLPQAFFDKYSYYSFFRLTFPQAKGKAECIATAKKFLKIALPEMIRIWPDWKELSESEQ